MTTLYNFQKVSVRLKPKIHPPYPFLLTPSITWRTALLLDLGVSDLSVSVELKFSVDFFSAASGKNKTKNKHSQTINKNSTQAAVSD